MRTGGSAGSRGRGRSGGSQPPFRLEAQRAGVPWAAVIKWLAILGVAGAALVAATAAFVFWMYGRDPNLPDYQTLADYHPKQVTVITDGNDRRIGEIYSERRTVVAYDKVPPIVVDAFVAAEDNSFWTHRGVDYWGMFRALITNLRAGHTRQGASTITQQVVKTFLLTPERTFRRKIQEIVLARRLESSLTKQEIMTLYMNQIYFGHGRYGVEEAARFYFGKHVAELNIGEAAMLGGLPQSPENISPRKNPKRAKERQTYVLNQLAAMQKITVAEAQKWIDAPIRVVERPFPELGSAPEWVDLARREVVKRYSSDEAALDKAGATVRTTLDPSLQAVAQKALQSGLRAIDRRHGIGRPVRNVKPDKIEAEIAKLAKRLPRGGPVAKESYDAVVTHVSDDDRELVVDLGDHPAAIVLGGEDDARFNPPDADGKTRSPSERFKPGDVVSVMLAATPAAKPAGKADKTTDKETDKEAEDDEPRDATRGGVNGPASPGQRGRERPLSIDEPRDATRGGVNGPASPGQRGRERPLSIDAAPKHAKQRAVFAPGPEGAVVIIDLKTRKVRALVGGYAPKVGGFDRATMAHRQPGSSFKPYLYAAAIDSGKYTAASVVNDVPQSFDKVDPNYRPKNYETGRYDGPVRLRYALSRSINSISLELAYNLQPETVVAFAKKMGIASELKPDLSIALGSHEVTPLEHTNAVATLATGGIAAPAQFIDAIDGKRLPAPAGEQVLRPEVAYVVADMMRSVVTEGTAIGAAVLKIPIAGKTGTSNEAKDTWFVGLTPDYAIGVWIGYDDPRPMPRETGGSNAVPVYVDIMKQLSPPAKAFPRPPHVVEATIDKQTGLLAPEGAPKQTTLNEVFVEGTQPTEVAPMAGDVTEDNKTKGEYED